jgi:hypothetical protein
MEEGDLALYKSGDALYFYAYDRVFRLDEDTVVAVVGPRSRRSLRVMKRGQVIFETSYTPLVKLGPLPDDPTPMVEEEHFDFGPLHLLDTFYTERPPFWSEARLV